MTTLRVANNKTIRIEYLNIPMHPPPVRFEGASRYILFHIPLIIYLAAPFGPNKNTTGHRTIQKIKLY